MPTPNMVVLALKITIMGCTGMPLAVPLIDWISDTRSQGCSDLQSLVKCLDHRGMPLAVVVKEC
jgi:hypothetical protein